MKARSGPCTYEKEFGDILHELGRDTTQKSGKHELILVIYHEPIRAVSRNLSNSVGGLGA